jgi:hypothetical protein
LAVKLARASEIGGLSSGILIIVAVSLLSPGFIAEHFSSADSLHAVSLRAIQVLRITLICLGVIIAVVSGLYLTRRAAAHRFLDFISRLSEQAQKRFVYWPFCLLCFTAALVFGLLVTQSGPGITTDSMMYMEVGESLYQGHGFTSYHTGPPLYPMLIAGLMHLGLDAEQAARVLPVLCFALLMPILFFLGKNTNSVFLGYLVCLMVLAFTPLLMITSYAWTEMVYVFFAAAALLCLSRYMATDGGSRRVLGICSVLVALAILTKYAGITLLLTGLVVIVVQNWPRLKKMIYQALVLGLVSCLPVLPWLYRSTVISHQVVGFGWEPSQQGLFANINLAAVAFLYDFFAGLTIVRMIPDFFAGSTAQDLLSTSQLSIRIAYLPLAIIVIGVVALVLYVRARSARPLLQYLEKNYLVIAYVLIYLVVIIAMRTISFAGMCFRSTSLSYPFLILVALSFIFFIYRQLKGMRWQQPTFAIIAVLCTLFIVFQANNSVSFYQEARYGQGYNSPFWRESQGISWVSSSVPANATIYSDHPYMMEFRLKRPVASLPASVNEEEIQAFIATVRDDENTFLITFKTMQPTTLLSHEELLAINEQYGFLTIVADFPKSIVWQVRPNK